MNLGNKRVVITGAASGIGKALAEALAAEGARLMLADLDEKRVEALAEELGEATGIACDVSDHAAVERLAETAHASLGGVDLVFANAGTILNGPLINASPAEFDWLMGVNLRGAWSCMTVFARLMQSQPDGGRICLTASEHALGMQHTGAGVYTASKQAALGLAEVLRAELRPAVGISVFCPGLVATGLANAVIPGHLPQPRTHQRAFSRAVLAKGMSAAEAAQAAIAGVCRGDDLIVTHPNSFAAAERRFAAISEAFAAQAPVGDDANRYDVNQIVADLITAQKDS